MTMSVAAMDLSFEIRSRGIPNVTEQRKAKLINTKH